MNTTSIIWFIEKNKRDIAIFAFVIVICFYVIHISALLHYMAEQNREEIAIEMINDAIILAAVDPPIESWDYISINESEYNHLLIIVCDDGEMVHTTCITFEDLPRDEKGQLITDKEIIANWILKSPLFPTHNSPVEKIRGWIEKYSGENLKFKIDIPKDIVVEP